MRQRLLLLLLLLVIGLYWLINGPAAEYDLFSFPEKLSQSADTNSTNPTDQPLTGEPTPVSVLTVPPAQMRDALHAAYRLKPDKRFLLAVEEIHHFLSGQAPQQVTADFQNNRWTVRYGATEVATLPEFPDFPDALNLLTHWAQAVHEKYPLCLTADNLEQQGLIDRVRYSAQALRCPNSFRLMTAKMTPQDFVELDEQLDRFLAPEVAVAARRMNDLWSKGVHHRRLLQQGTRALLFLNVQSLDRLEAADQLAAKALALLALTKSLTNLPVAHEEALLAERMDYSAHAERVAKGLPDSDPARPFVTGNDKSLMEVALGQGKNIEARYLGLLRLVDHADDLQVFTSGLQALFPSDWMSLPIIKAGLDLNRFGTNSDLAEALPRLVLLNLAQEVGMPNLIEIVHKAREKPVTDEAVRALMASLDTILRAESSTLFDRFESGLQVLDRHYRGPFLDSPTYQAYYRGYFFSSYYILGLHYLDSLSSETAARQFAAALGNPRTGTAARFQRWYSNLAQSKAGKADLSRLVDDLARLPGFGAPPLLRTMEEQKKHFRYGDPAVLKSVKLLVVRMDTRPSHRGELAYTAYDQLMDQKLTEKLYRSVLETSPSKHQHLQAWFASYTGDSQRLHEILHSPHLKPYAKVNALKALNQLKTLTPETVRHEFAQLLLADPDSWPLRREYIGYLNEEKDYKTARLMAQDWLKRDVSTAGLEYVHAHNVIADTLYQEGRYQEGLAAIAPVVKSWQGGAMQNAARLLDKLNRRGEAERMAALALERYPDSLHARALMAEIYWQHGKYAQAADVLKGHPYPIDWDDWKFIIGKAFVEMFKNRPARVGLEAFSALIKSRSNPWDLQVVAEAMKEAGNHELASGMIVQVKVPDRYDQAYLLLQGYQFRKAWQGKTVALAWLRNQVPPDLTNAMGTQSFVGGAPELLWDLIEEPEKGDHPEFTWLLRAAAHLQLGPDKDPHGAVLLRHFQESHPSDPESGRFHLLGRYLLGLEREETILALATDASKRCETGYYFGLRAESEGRMEAASDWYRIAVETASKGDNEYNWALNRLYKWYEQTKSLSLLAAMPR